MPRADWDSSDGDAPSPRVQAYAVPSTGGVVQFQAGHDLSLSAIACPARDPPGAEPMSVSAAGFDPPNRPHSVFGRASLPSLIRSLAIASLLAAGGMNTACEVADTVTTPFRVIGELGGPVVGAVASAVGGAVDAFTVGNTIPGFPTSVALEDVVNGTIRLTGESLTITLEYFGWVRTGDDTYRCHSVRCIIENGVVTLGEVLREATNPSGGQSGGSNGAPVWVGSVPDQILNAGGSPLTLDLSRNFQDPDEDSLTYTATSSRESVARVVVSGNRLEITPVSDGTTLIQVTATDPDGLSASQSFEIKVGNAPPRAGNTAKVFALAEGGEVLVSLEGARFGDPIFHDPNGDPLVYAATSTNRNVVRVTRVDHSGADLSLALLPVGAGTTTIVVTATDPGGLSAELQVPITVGDGGGPATITISKCETQPFTPGRVRVNIEGEVRAHQALPFATVRIYVNGEYARFDHVTGLAAGQSETFAIFDFVDATASIRCGATVEWRAGS